MKLKDELISKATATTPFIMTALSIEEIQQITLLVLGVISSIVSILYTIYKWYVKAKLDNKISLDELNELKKELEAHEIKIPKK